MPEWSARSEGAQVLHVFDRTEHRPEWLIRISARILRQAIVELFAHRFNTEWSVYRTCQITRGTADSASIFEYDRNRVGVVD